MGKYSAMAIEDTMNFKYKANKRSINFAPFVRSKEKERLEELRIAKVRIAKLEEELRILKLNGTLREAINYFREFRQSLGTPKAPEYIQLTKKKLEESWEFIAEEDEEIKLIISALEGAIRQRKWQEYKQNQVATLQAILEECVDGKLHSHSDVLKTLSTLYKQDIDIFPSAPGQAYEEDETESDVVS